MSKKLIAVAAAAALALTGLVAVPAGATTITGVEISDSTGTNSNVASHTASTSAVFAATAMTSRTLDFSSTSSNTRNVVRFAVSTASATTVTVTSTGGVELSDALVDAAAESYTIDRNLTSLSKATTTGALIYTFYAYSTSTTAGTVVIETPSSKNTYFVKGVAGEAYNITNVVFPTAIISGQADNDDNTNIVRWNTTDVFGNSIESQQGTLTAFGAPTPSVSTETWKTATKVNEAKIHGTAGATVALSLQITPKSLTALGWPAPVKGVFTTISAASLADRVTDLTAQVAALQAQLAESRPKANSVTKKRWNRLVRAHRALGGTAKLKR